MLALHGSKLRFSAAPSHDFKNKDQEGCGFLCKFKTRARTEEELTEVSDELEHARNTEIA